MPSKYIYILKFKLTAGWYVRGSLKEKLLRYAFLKDIDVSVIESNYILVSVYKFTAKDKNKEKLLDFEKYAHEVHVSTQLT